MIGIFTIVTYVQQQQITDRYRKQDQDLANLTRLKDIEIVRQSREQDEKQANNLHFQNVYKNIY
jgi:hypothetical protein